MGRQQCEMGCETPVALPPGRATALCRNRRSRRVAASVGFQRLITGGKRCIGGMQAGSIEADSAARMATHRTCLDPLRCSDAEVGGLGAGHSVTDRDNRVEVVEFDLPTNLPVPLGLNSPNYSECSLGLEFARRVNLLGVVAFGAKIHAKQVGDPLLVQPERLGFVQHLDPNRSFCGLVEDRCHFVWLIRDLAHWASTSSSRSPVS